MAASTSRLVRCEAEIAGVGEGDGGLSVVLGRGQ
jgi:hypothetical protein